MAQPGATGAWQDNRTTEEITRRLLLLDDFLAHGAEDVERRRARAIVMSMADAGQDPDLLRAAKQEQQRERKPQQALRPPHLYFTAKDGIIQSATEWTATALGYRVSQMVGARGQCLLHKGEAETNPVAMQAYADAQASPGTYFSYPGGHVIHEDGHVVECVLTTMFWSGEELAIDIELTEGEVQRVRALFPQQFLDPGERARFADWRLARDHQEHAEPEMRKWSEAHVLRRLIRDVNLAAGQDWDKLTINSYLEELESRSGVSISENLLRDRFKRFKWGRLKEGLHRMALQDTAGLRLF